MHGTRRDYIAWTYPSLPSIKRPELFIQKYQNQTILIYKSPSVLQPPKKINKKTTWYTTRLPLFQNTPAHLGDDLVTEDNFSADTKGERFSRLFEGDGAFFAWGSLRFFAESCCLPDVLSSPLASFSGDSFLDFFRVDFSDDLEGLPLFLK